MSRRGVRALAAVVAVLVVAGVALVVAGLHPARRGATGTAPTTSIPAAVLPALRGGPSVANFCAVLAGDVGGLAELGKVNDDDQIVAVLNRYVAAAPAIAAQAPAPIAGPARLYVAETTTIYGAMARSRLRSHVVNAALLRPFDTPAALAAQAQVRTYAEHNCGFDPQDPAAAAARSA
jgi:hypothetical protein